MPAHFLKIDDYSTKEILTLLERSAKFKKYQKEGRDHLYLKGKTMAMIFQKPSTRTRVSFEVAMQQLGGHVIHLRGDEINMGVREPISDIARTLERYLDIVMIRSNTHSDIEEYAQFSKVPVINGLSDYAHPCQVLSDIFTITEYKPKLEGLKLCFIGDGNNVCRSLIEISQLLNIQMTVCCPKGYEPFPKATHQYDLIYDPYVAAKDADVIYTDVWVSMGQEEIQTKKLADFKGYTITKSILNEAKQDAIFMHCLPAHRNEEVTDEVLESRNSIVFDQAENRLHAQKAIICYLLGGDAWL